MITNDNSYNANITLDGKQRELQFKGKDAKRLSQHTAMELTADCRVSGASKLETMLRAGNPLAVFSLSIDDYDILLDHKAGGIFYAALSDKVDGKDIFDVFIKADNVTFLCDYLRKYKMNHVPQHDAGVCIKESAEVPSHNNATANQQAGQSHLRYTTDGKGNESITVPPRPQPKDYHDENGKIKISQFLSACEEWKRKYDRKKRIRMNLTPEEEAILHPPFGQRTSIRAQVEIIEKHRHDYD